MDRFLIFFQRYVFMKNYLLMEVEFQLLDTLENIRPKHSPKLRNLKQAQEACARIIEAEKNRSPITAQQVISHYCHLKPGGVFKDLDYPKELEIEKPAEKEGKIDASVIKQQKVEIEEENEKVELDEFDLEFQQMLQEQSASTRKTVKN